MKWENPEEKRFYAPHDYRRKDGWMLYYDNTISTPQWVLCHAVQEQLRSQYNPLLGRDQDGEAKVWATRELAASGFHQGHASLVV